MFGTRYPSQFKTASQLELSPVSESSKVWGTARDTVLVYSAADAEAEMLITSLVPGQ